MFLLLIITGVEVLRLTYMGFLRKLLACWRQAAACMKTYTWEARINWPQTDDDWMISMDDFNGWFQCLRCIFFIRPVPCAWRILQELIYKQNNRIIIKGRRARQGKARTISHIPDIPTNEASASWISEWGHSPTKQCVTTCSLLWYTAHAH